MKNISTVTLKTIWFAAFALVASSHPAIADADSPTLVPIISLLTKSDITYRELNDTGLTWGGDYPSGNNSSCIGETIAQQDCSFGRDVSHNDDSDGHAGFSFTKIDVNGYDLPATENDWSCVRDNVTGLVWEKKEDDGGLQDKDHTYRWGGLTAEGRNSQNSATTYYDDWNIRILHANNNSICGFSDWRVPNTHELNSIVNYSRSSPSIDIDYFPNTMSYWYWSSSLRGGNDNNVWDVSFANGRDSYDRTHDAYHVRLVRSDH